MSEIADNTRTVVIERVFAHPPEKLWRALTESPEMAQWLLKNDFAPVAGRKFQFRFDPMQGWDGVIDCEVQIVEPLKRLSYSWCALGLDSAVMWTLTPVEGGTHVLMEHSGFPKDHDAAFKGAQYGWQKFIGNLEQWLGGAE